VGGGVAWGAGLQAALGGELRGTDG
jgi:hypothetical protein